MTGIEFIEAGGLETLKAANSWLTAIVITQAIIIVLMFISLRRSRQRKFILETVANEVQRGGWQPLSECIRSGITRPQPKHTK